MTNPGYCFYLIKYRQGKKGFASHLNSFGCFDEKSPKKSKMSDLPALSNFERKDSMQRVRKHRDSLTVPPIIFGGATRSNHAPYEGEHFKFVQMI